MTRSNAITHTLVNRLLVAKDLGLLTEVIQDKPRGYTVEIQIQFNRNTQLETVRQLERHVAKNYGYLTQRYELRSHMTVVRYLSIRMQNASKEKVSIDQNPFLCYPDR